MGYPQTYTYHSEEDLPVLTRSVDRVKPMPQEANPNDTSIIWHIVWEEEGRAVGGTYFQGYWGAWTDVRQYEQHRAAGTWDTAYVIACGHDFESTGCPYVDEMVD